MCSSDLIFLTKPDGRVVRANPAACRLFDRTEKEIVSIGCQGIVDTTDPQFTAVYNDRNIIGQSSVELNCIRRDGSSFPGILLSALFHDESGEAWTVTIIRDLTDIKQLEESWHHRHAEWIQIAAYDALTGILNRRGFEARFDPELQRAKRNGFSLSLIMMDIDNFKSINDTYGHTVGDKLLQAFSNLLIKKIRPYDIVGRHGGDEFVICLPHTTCLAGSIVAEHLRQQIFDTPFDIDGNKIKITTSIGIVGYVPSINTTVEIMIGEADQLMYIAKEKRNFVHHRQGV